MNPRPVLEYERSGCSGLYVDRSAGYLSIVLLPFDVWGRFRHGAVWVAAPLVLNGAIVAALIVVASAVRHQSPLPLLSGLVALCSVSFLVIWPAAVVIGGFYNQTVWVDVLPEAVRLVAIGRSLNLNTTWTRERITAIDVGIHGVRIRFRDTRRPEWIVFGNRAQHRGICQLLRQELHLVAAQA
jgi:hypothetical protein